MFYIKSYNISIKSVHNIFILYLPNSTQSLESIGCTSLTRTKNTKTVKLKTQTTEIQAQEDAFLLLSITQTTHKSNKEKQYHNLIPKTTWFIYYIVLSISYTKSIFACAPQKVSQVDSVFFYYFYWIPFFARRIDIIVLITFCLVFFACDLFWRRFGWWLMN